MGKSHRGRKVLTQHKLKEKPLKDDGNKNFRCRDCGLVIEVEDLQAMNKHSVACESKGRAEKARIERERKEQRAREEEIMATRSAQKARAKAERAPKE